MTKRSATNVEQLDLHLKQVFENSVNFKERVISLIGEIDDELFHLVESSLTEMESYNRQPITIRIYSEGGDEYAAQAIVGRMKRSKCKIVTEGYGCIMSAATLILAAGDRRRVSKYCSFMWHESSYSVDERHSSAKATVAHMEWLENSWAQWMAELSSKPKKFFYEEAKHVDKYWSPEQLIEYGIVDEIF